MQVERSRGDEQGDSGSESESGVILRNIVKADPCVFMKTRVEVISAGEVGCADLHGLDQKRKDYIEAGN